MKRTFTILANLALAGCIYLLAIATQDGTPWLLYGLIVLSASASFLSVVALLPISAFWAMLSDTGFKEACKARLLRVSDETEMDFILAICKIYDSTNKMIDGYHTSSFVFQLSFVSSVAVSLAIVTGTGWLVVAGIILVLDCVAYGCLRWLIKNFRNVSKIAVEATEEAFRLDPRLKEKK